METPTKTERVVMSGPAGVVFSVTVMVWLPPRLPVAAAAAVRPTRTSSDGAVPAPARWRPRAIVPIAARVNKALICFFLDPLLPLATSRLRFVEQPTERGVFSRFVVGAAPDNLEEVGRIDCVDRFIWFRKIRLVENSSTTGVAEETVDRAG